MYKKTWICSAEEFLELHGKLILQSFRHFTYVTAHSPTLASLYLRHSSFSNISVALPTSQLILQPFRCFMYVTAHSPTLLSLLLLHRLFTYVTWTELSPWVPHVNVSYCLTIATRTIAVLHCTFKQAHRDYWLMTQVKQIYLRGDGWAPLLMSSERLQLTIKCFHFICL